MADIKISVINESTKVNDNDVKPVVDALQIQVTRDFAPAWGVGADLIFVPKGQKPDSSTWWLVLLDNSDQAGALGYHELTTAGLPIGKVFVESDLEYNLSWSVTASHELLEMLGDPSIDLTVLIQNSNTTGTLYAAEVCDPVEDDSLAYDINNVKVSDFVLPSYFQPLIPGNKWDFCGHLTGHVPTIAQGGYYSYFQIGTGTGWHQVMAQKAPTDRSNRQVMGSRRWKRANKTSLKRSTI